MALNRKAQKETDLAIRHLINYVESSEQWAECFRQIENEIVSPVADKLGIDFDQTMDKLFGGPYEGDVFGYLFEETVTCDWNNQGSAVNEYLKKRGWREKPHGRKYLRALADSQVEVWVTTNISPGEWIDVRLSNKKGKSKRVYERSASEQLTVGQHLAARVMAIDNKRCFSGTLLPLTEVQAERIQQAVDEVVPFTNALFQEMLAEKVIDEISEEAVAEEIENSQIEVVGNTAFAQWALSVLREGPAPTPEIRNTDDEAIVLTKHRMKISGDEQHVQETLGQHFESTQPNEWIWLNDQQKIVATIRLKKENLELETNSVERGKRALSQLKEILGDALGKPIGVHESLEQVMAGHADSKGKVVPLSQEDLQDHPEMIAQMQAHLQNHYRDSLDQPIPMLNDMTPRECAENPETRDKAIHWLKNIELHNLKIGQLLDTHWMWEELKLMDYR